MIKWNYILAIFSLDKTCPPASKTYYFRKQMDIGIWIYSPKCPFQYQCKNACKVSVCVGWGRFYVHMSVDICIGMCLKWLKSIYLNRLNLTFLKQNNVGLILIFIKSTDDPSMIFFIRFLHILSHIIKKEVRLLTFFFLSYSLD